MKRVVLRRFFGVSSGYEHWAYLARVAEETLRLSVSVMALISLLLIRCRCRSGAREADPNVPCGGPFSMIRFFCNNSDRVSLLICVEQVHPQPFPYG
jgi:hypothetical protein